MPVAHLLTTLALSFAGFTALSLAMDRHFGQSTGRRVCAMPLRWGFRAAGCLILMASLWCCLQGWGTVVGAIAWWGVLTVGALGVVVHLTYWPRMLPALATILGVAALLAWCAVRLLPA